MAKFTIVIMTLAGIAFTYPAAATPDGSEIGREETLVCASRDRDAMSMIEEKGEVQTVEAEKLAEAMFSVMAARAACREGRGAEALEYYQAAHRDLMTRLAHGKGAPFAYQSPASSPSCRATSPTRRPA